MLPEKWKQERGKSMKGPLIEGCVDSFASAMAAIQGGADRLELCGALVIGGVTPSPALFRQVRETWAGKIHVLIRPRFGDFLYTRREGEQMEEEISAFRDLGCDGVVIGALTPDGELDGDLLGRLMARAGDLSVTLHRAFDMTRDPVEAMEAAVDLGVQTILTSGQAPSAAEGTACLKTLHEKAAGRIHIMAGSGVKAENILPIHERTGITTFHTTGRKGNLDSGMRYRKEGVSMGLPSLSEYEIWQTDEETFRTCAELVHGLG